MPYPEEGATSHAPTRKRHITVSVARVAFHAGLEDLGTARQTRETAVETLRSRMRGLIDESGAPESQQQALRR